MGRHVKKLLRTLPKYADNTGYSWDQNYTKVAVYILDPSIKDTTLTNELVTEEGVDIYTINVGSIREAFDHFLGLRQDRQYDPVFFAAAEKDWQSAGVLACCLDISYEEAGRVGLTRCPEVTEVCMIPAKLAASRGKARGGQASRVPGASAQAAGSVAAGVAGGVATGHALEYYGQEGGMQWSEIVYEEDYEEWSETIWEESYEEVDEEEVVEEDEEEAEDDEEAAEDDEEDAEEDEEDAEDEEEDAEDEDEEAAEDDEEEAEDDEEEAEDDEEEAEDDEEEAEEDEAEADDDEEEAGEDDEAEHSGDE